MNFEKKLTVLDAKGYKNATFEIVEVNSLDGTPSADMAMQLFFANEQGLKMRFIRIHLNEASIKTEAGALYYYHGKIKSKSNIGGVSGYLTKSIKGSLTNESTIKPEYEGTGVIYLEPSTSHYLIVELDNSSLIIDKALFYCCSSEISVEPWAQKNISAALLGGEGLFQICLRGTGVAVLEMPVPLDEIQTVELEPGDECKVDGSFAIMRDASVDFAVTKSDKSLLASAKNGEGLLNTFSTKVGGRVWLAPTAPFYKRMMYGMSSSNNSSNNS